MCCGVRFLILLFFLGNLAGCTPDEASEKMLIISISEDSTGFSISDYKLMDQAFKKSHQQGNYQALLLDSEGNSLRKITFQDIENLESPDADRDITVSIPLDEKLHQISIFELDGRSGHYMRTDESMVTWTLPESVKEKAKQSRIED